MSKELHEAVSVAQSRISATFKAISRNERRIKRLERMIDNLTKQKMGATNE